MIYCYQCPLRDVCSVLKRHTEPVVLSIRLNWLPKEAEKECPLFRTINKLEREMG